MNNSNNSVDNNFMWKYLCNDINKISKETDILISRSKTARNLILKLSTDNKINCIKIIGILADDTFEFNSFHSLSKLLKLVSPDKNIRKLWESIDKLLTIYIDKFYTDIELFNKLSEIPFRYLDDYDKIFLNKIMKCFEKYGLVAGNTKDKINVVTNLYSQINSLENKIINNLHNNQPQTMNLFYLAHMRNQYAKLLKYDSYSKFKSNINIVHLQKTLKDLISNLHQTCYDELQFICNELNCSKISISDILQYISKLNSKYKINIKDAMNFIFNLINNKFNLQFTKLSNILTWHDNIDVYLVKYQNEVYGYIYIDLLARPGKLPNVLSIILNQAVVYPYNSGILKVPVTALIGKFSNEISYIDIINIFREMGQIVHTLFHRSKYGITIEPDMKLIIPYLFECIIRDISNIKLLFENDYINIYNIITIDRAFKLKYKCINTLYDYFLHGSNIELDNKSLIEKYNQIFKAILNKSYDQYNLSNQISHIPTDVIIQLIYNGGILYSDVTNCIIAFNLYDLLKEKNLFNDFVDNVLRESSVSFKLAVSSFMNSKIENINNINFNNIKKINKVPINHTLSDNDLQSLTDNQTIKNISDNTNYFTETDIIKNN